ncbi:MAG: dienelactone hydrolase family protein [Proteobacteria bacterium]|nr:dienelactone hydrolase family protein [Pseudomonadota bacterium]
MHEKTVDVPTADGMMETFITHPEAGGPFPPVILFMDVWGIREQLRDIARQIACVGYVAVLPNLYYRMGGEHFDYRNPDGTTASLKDLPEAQQQKILDYRTHLSDPMAIADVAALLDYLGKDAAVRPGPAGSIGYCMGGRHVIRVAAAFPETFVAGASLHGTHLVTDAGDSPHLDAPRVRGMYYSGFGERDHYTPPETIAAVETAFAGQGCAYTQLVHPGAAHGYAISDRDVYDKQAAYRDWAHIFAMYDRMLRA